MDGANPEGLLIISDPSPSDEDTPLQPGKKIDVAVGIETTVTISITADASSPSATTTTTTSGTTTPDVTDFMPMGLVLDVEDIPQFTIVFLDTDGEVVKSIPVRNPSVLKCLMLLLSLICITTQVFCSCVEMKMVFHFTNTVILIHPHRTTQFVMNLDY